MNGSECLTEALRLIGIRRRAVQLGAPETTHGTHGIDWAVYEAKETELAFCEGLVRGLVIKHLASFESEDMFTEKSDDEANP